MTISLWPGTENCMLHRAGHSQQHFYSVTRQSLEVLAVAIRSLISCTPQSSNLGPQSSVFSQEKMSSVAPKIVQDHLLDVLRPNLPERSFRDGDILLRQGEQGTHLMYLLQGQVEVLVKLQPLREPRQVFPSLPFPFLHILRAKHRSFAVFTITLCVCRHYCGQGASRKVA